MITFISNFIKISEFFIRFIDKYVFIEKTIINRQNYKSFSISNTNFIANDSVNLSLSHPVFTVNRRWRPRRISIQNIDGDIYQDNINCVASVLNTLNSQTVLRLFQMYFFFLIF